MLFLRILWTLSAIFSVSASSSSDVKYTVLDDRFIVVYSETPVDLNMGNALDKVSDHVGSKLDALHTFNYPGVLRGHSVSATGLTKEQLQGAPGVNAVYEVLYFDQQRSDSLTQGASSIPISSDESSSLVQSGVAKDHYSPHVMSGLDILHQRGLLGEGIKIAFVEGGIQYNHTLLGARGCFGGENCVVKKGYAFASDDSASESPDPYSNCDVRSTHILGQIVAPPNKYGFVGAAPNADVAWYRIFTCTGGATSDTIIKAFLKAAEDGCNVISNSLISNVGFIDNDLGPITLNKLAERGIFSASAWGVKGNEGLFFPPGPGAGSTGISAASVDVEVLPFAYSLTIQSKHGRNSLPYVSINPVPFTDSFGVYFFSTDPLFNAVGQVCGDLPVDIPDLTGKVAVIQRGNCTFSEKFAIIKKYNPKVVIVINGLDSNPPPYFGQVEGNAYAISMTYEDAAKLLKLSSKDQDGLRINFNDKTLFTTLKNTNSGGKISSYSSFGPTNDLGSGPTFAVPGATIGGIFPNNMIGVADGFSSPISNAAAALILQARPHLTPKELRALMATTAKIIHTQPNKTDSPFETTLLQGGGLLSAVRAVDSHSLITPFAFRLNDSKFAVTEQEFTIKNLGRSPNSYTFGSIAAQTRTTYNDGASVDIIPSTAPAVLEGAKATVRFHQRALVVHPGQSRTVKVTIHAPALSPKDLARFPLYSGFITIHDSSNKQDFQIGYFGLAGNAVDLPVLDTTNRLAPAYLSGLNSNLSYPYLLDNTANSTDLHTQPNEVKTYSRATGVGIFVRLGQATRQFIIDVIPGDSKFRGTIPSDNNQNITEKASNQTTRERSKRHLETRAHPSFNHQHMHSIRSNNSNELLYQDVEIVGNIVNITQKARDESGAVGPFVSQGTYLDKNGTSHNLTDGTPYRFLVRALRMTADPTLESSWESWVSPLVQFKS